MVLDFDSFKTFDGTDLMFGFDHLSNLHIHKHDLHGFIVKWNHILDNMGENAVSKGTLRDVFYRKIQNEKDLHYDFNHYERMSEKERSYDWLMDRVNSVIKQQEQRCPGKGRRTWTRKGREERQQ